MVDASSVFCVSWRGSGPHQRCHDKRLSVLLDLPQVYLPAEALSVELVDLFGHWRSEPQTIRLARSPCNRATAARGRWRICWIFSPAGSATINVIP